ncbi:papain family cysteine protease (macronuclear) [Tetrahymena thermophila SB210]|uniref:Papain family cysteine protease n=1 Tax=Tetrahymena thermophila (strain SB210) TaxID=312017 RepID=Q23VA2_TETTS|nr:papain family cysteine protease [Tetrahymena thermophila SB210]EAS00456.1 papain family cysteine protease [Tetrahymena thermophila SB210]|eukprot:XP_001020701.1 papain family cysteine protease [Tetrahymena thermophila SB210]
MKFQNILIGLLFLSSCLAQLISQKHSNSKLSSVQIKDLLDFNQWKYNHGKNYFNADEANFRQVIYLLNLQKFNEHNSNPNHSYKVGTNQFSDLSQEEFESLILNPFLSQDFHHRFLDSNNDKNLNKNSNHTSTNNNNNNSKNQNNTHTKNNTHTGNSNNKTNTVPVNPTTPTDPLKVVPQSVDWRLQGKVSPVKNQGQCGACWAFSATGLAESVNLMRNNTLQQYSEQELIDCTYKIYSTNYFNQGCDGGWAANGMNYIQQKGVFSESDYPYSASLGTCNNATSATRQKAFFAKDSIYFYTWNSNKTNELQYAVSTQPISVQVDATFWNSYSSGVFNNCSTDNWTVNHAPLLVGYTKEGNWIVKNSWGTNWGQNGYIILAPGNTCNITKAPLGSTI